MAKSYWIAVQVQTAEGRRELPIVWNHYADTAKKFAAEMAKLPGFLGVGVGPEDKAPTWKRGDYVDMP